MTISIVFPFSLWLSPFLLPKSMSFVLVFNILFRVHVVYVLQLFDLCTLQIEPYFSLLNLFLMFIFIYCLYIILYWTVFLCIFFCFSFATSSISPVILLFFFWPLFFCSFQQCFSCDTLSVLGLLHVFNTYISSPYELNLLAYNSLPLRVWLYYFMEIQICHYI